jgi:hypothetical protein
VYRRLVRKVGQNNFFTKFCAAAVFAVGDSHVASPATKVRTQDTPQATRGPRKEKAFVRSAEVRRTHYLSDHIVMISYHL